jgi:predicted RNA-binding Zn-ribbon protein involved in translation (DUF1610 family)
VSQGNARAGLAEGVVPAVQKAVFCQRCGSDRVYRVFREGFLQEKIYPLLGLYPWKCKKCGERIMLRKRRLRKSRREEEVD